MKMAYWHPLLPTALQEYESLQRKHETAAMEVRVNTAQGYSDTYCVSDSWSNSDQYNECHVI